MSRYIDADILKEKLKEEYGGVHNEVSLSFFITFLTESFINKIQTADVKPVKHSNWKRGENFGGEYYECEACGRRSRPDLYKFDYCPRCGAKMDGGNIDG